MFGMPATTKRAHIYNLAILLGTCPTEMRTYVYYKHTRMFLAVLPISAKNWKQSKSQSITDKVNKLDHSQVVEYQIAVKRNKLINPTM